MALRKREREILSGGRKSREHPIGNAEGMKHDFETELKPMIEEMIADLKGAKKK